MMFRESERETRDEFSVEIPSRGQGGSWVLFVVAEEMAALGGRDEMRDEGGERGGR